MVLKAFKFCFVVTIYLIVMYVFADTCYKVGHEDGFKNGQDSTLRTIEDKIGPLIEQCTENVNSIKMM